MLQDAYVPDGETVVPHKPGTVQPYNHPGHGKGVFDFTIPATFSSGQTRYAFIREDGERWDLPINKSAQGGRWETAAHAEGDFERYKIEHKADPDKFRRRLDAMWPGDYRIRQDLHRAVLKNETFDQLAARLAKRDSWRSQSDGEPDPQPKKDIPPIAGSSRPASELWGPNFSKLDPIEQRMWRRRQKAYDEDPRKRYSGQPDNRGSKGPPPWMEQRDAWKSSASDEEKQAENKKYAAAEKKRRIAIYDRMKDTTVYSDQWVEPELLASKRKMFNRDKMPAPLDIDQEVRPISAIVASAAATVASKFPKGLALLELMPHVMVADNVMSRLGQSRLGWSPPGYEGGHMEVKEIRYSDLHRDPRLPKQEPAYNTIQNKKLIKIAAAKDEKALADWLVAEAQSFGQIGQEANETETLVYLASLCEAGGGPKLSPVHVRHLLQRALVDERQKKEARARHRERVNEDIGTAAWGGA